MAFETFGIIAIAWLSLTIILSYIFYHTGVEKFRGKAILFKKYYELELEEVKEIKIIRNTLIQANKELRKRVRDLEQLEDSQK